jgi:SAM-dependent methyltransferase
MKETSNMPELSSQGRGMSIPALDHWLASAQGRYVLDWEHAGIDAAAADVFGFNALQLGLPQCDFLRSNRIPLRQRAAATGNGDVRCELTALPFAAQSVDLVILPHVLEFHPDPHQILREIERILIPEGQLMITGFNPISLWGTKNRFSRQHDFPWQGSYLSVPRLKDWLKLLNFEVDRGSFGCYAPPCDQQKWLQRWHFMERAGARWWGFAGGVYLLRAIKRTHSMRLIMPKWRQSAVGAKALRPIAQKEGHGR